MAKMTLDEIANGLGMREKTEKSDQHVYGVVESVNGDTYEVQIAGSDTSITCARLVGAVPGDLVLVTIFGDGHAVITNRYKGDYDAVEAKDKADVVAKDLSAESARIGSLEAENVKVDGRLTANEADITKLKADTAEFDNVVAKKADIDFANVDTAVITTNWVQNLLVRGEMVAREGTVFRLIGVHISGDLIDANTLQADRLLLKGANGLYYALNVDALGQTTAAADEKYQNGIDGSAIIAHSITADELTVQNIVGTGGWINLAEGTFKYLNANTGNGIQWDGEHLTVYGDVTLSSGTNMADAVVSSTSMYYISTSPDKLDGGTWSSDVPKWETGQYVWQKIVSTKASGAEVETEPICLNAVSGTDGKNGADAITIIVSSSAGTIFTNKPIATTLEAHVYMGGRELTGAALDAVGEVKWYKDDLTTPVATGRILTIESGTIANTASYVAQLEGEDPGGQSGTGPKMPTTDEIILASNADVDHMFTTT